MGTFPDTPNSYCQLSLLRKPENQVLKTTGANDRFSTHLAR